jgi:hypothetical protein
MLPVFENIDPVTRCVDEDVKDVRELAVQEGLSFSDDQKHSYFTS